MLKILKVPGKVFIVGASAALLLGASVFAFNRITNNDNSGEATEITTADGETLKVEPTTNTEKQETEEHKQQLADGGGQPANNSVSVVITEASGLGVRAYIGGVFEEGGTCTATATQGTQTVTRTTTGFKNVSYTQCPPMEWSLPTGSWAVTVNYKSPRAEASKSTEIQV